MFITDFLSKRVFFITALIIYGADIDYSRRFREEGDDFFVDDDDLMLMRDNGSLVATFPSGEITRTAKTWTLNLFLLMKKWNRKFKGSLELLEDSSQML